MPYEETNAVITTGPVVATYGAFCLRTLMFTLGQHEPQQLPFYLVAVKIGSHHETAFALTCDLDKRWEAVEPIIRQPLLSDAETIQRYPLLFSERPADLTAGAWPVYHDIRREIRDRREWVAAGLDMLSSYAPAQTAEEGYAAGLILDGHGSALKVVPLREEIWFARCGAFSVKRVLLDPHYVLWPFPEAPWVEPWWVQWEPGHALLYSFEIYCEGCGCNRMIGVPRDRDPYAPITRSEVITGARHWIAATKLAMMTAEEFSWEIVEESRRLPILTAALEALEAEEAAERAEREGTGPHE